MISYGRSSFVQNLTKKLNQRKKEFFTTRFCQQVQDYIISNLCIMNGLRSSNIIELRVEDVVQASLAEGYPGYTSMVNLKYKTSTIYGEKIILMPNDLFKHICIYKDTMRGLLNPEAGEHLFVSSSSPKLSHPTIGSALTSSFKQASVFKKSEYQRVCPTRIRIACATFGCKAEGIDSGYFAKHFMKNKELTTQIDYNLYANHREALKLAMLMRYTFEVGGEKIVIKKEELNELTNAIISNKKVLPSKEQIMAWVNI